jgi:hypothetical protein
MVSLPASIDYPVSSLKECGGLLEYQIAKEALSQRKLSEFLNLALIVLIPKNAAKDSISGWRPITLLNVCYKILAKAIAILVG